MLEIANQTRHAVTIFPFTTQAGIDHACVLIKGTWDIARAGLTPSEALQAIAFSDVRHGPEGKGSVRYAADVGCWPKPATDVVLVGHAYTRTSRERTVDVGVRVGPVSKVVRVFGDRCWGYAVGRWVATEPRPFETMPLVYERAFGGRDETHADARKHDWERRNPHGTGFVTNGQRERVEGLRLPNLEDPRRLITSWQDRPAPACFGFTEGFWAPRASFAGTYDTTWQEVRAPLLPLDFDTRFFNAASAGLTTTGHLHGGEDVALANVDENGMTRFRLPELHWDVKAELKGKLTSVALALDTVFIDADARQVVLVWRGALACPRSFLGIRVVFVKEAS